MIVKKNCRKPGFSDHFSIIYISYKRKEYNIDVIEQSACLAVNLITTDHFAYFLNCTSVGQGSDSMMALASETFLGLSGFNQLFSFVPIFKRC